MLRVPSSVSTQIPLLVCVCEPFQCMEQRQQGLCLVPWGMFSV